MKKRLVCFGLIFVIIFTTFDFKAYATETTDTVVIETDENTKFFGNNTYKILGANGRDASVKKCTEAGGHLLTINSEEEQKFVEEWMYSYYGVKNKEGACWLGAHLKENWEWITGEEFSYTNWNINEPSGDGVYVILNKDGRWNDGRYGTYLTICEWDNSYTPLKDLQMIETVRLYTSDGGDSYIKQLNQLIQKLDQEGITQEEKLKQYNDFFVQNGFTDSQEGITYCYDAMNAKQAYDFLLSNDAFCAYQYWNYLHFTDKGQIARATLLVDEWIFNDGLVQYIEPSTYITQETESIKNYKTMLLDFMNNYSVEYELTKYIDNAIASVDSGIEVVNETYKSSYMKKLRNAHSCEEVNKILADYLEQAECKISADGKLEFNLEGFESISNLTEYGSKVTSICSDTLDYMNDLILLESRLNVIDSYSDFLESIVEGKEVLPYGLVVAAEQLLNELIYPYQGEIQKFIGQLEDYIVDDVYDFSGQIMGETLGGIVASIDLGKVIVDQITGIGELVRQSTYVEAYAYLGMYYSSLLHEAKERFVADETAENAWEFYHTYMLLLQLRIKGEEAYLEMNQEKGLVDILCKIGEWDYFGISDKEEFVNQIIQYTKSKCYFALTNAMDIENNQLYKKKVIVECPVSVDIYDANDNLIYSIYDKVEVDETNAYGRFVCKYVPASRDYVKVAYLYDNADYKIKACGEDTGMVECSIIETEDNLTYSIKGFDDIVISNNSIVEIESSKESYSIDENGDGSVDIEAEIVDKSKVYIQFDCQNSKQIFTVYVDGEGKFDMPEKPKKEGYIFSGWYDKPNGTGIMLADNMVVQKSITVYAYWVAESEEESTKNSDKIVSQESIEIDTVEEGVIVKKQEKESKDKKLQENVSISCDNEKELEEEKNKISSDKDTNIEDITESIPDLEVEESNSQISVWKIIVTILAIILCIGAICLIVIYVYKEKRED